MQDLSQIITITPQLTITIILLIIIGFIILFLITIFRKYGIISSTTIERKSPETIEELYEEYVDPNDESIRIKSDPKPKKPKKPTPLLDQDFEF